jgi:hypothetical protein
MEIESLIPMQNSLREPEQVQEMMEFVRSGGFFTEETISSFLTDKRKDASKVFKLNPIKVVRFEDARLYLHDGLHRSTAIWLAGRAVLDRREYVLEDWKYSEYLEINLADKWYTPFDPMTEVRIADFLSYKKKVEQLINGEPKPSDDEIIRFIHDSYKRGEYTEPRTTLTVPQLAEHTLAIVARVE